MAINKEHYRDFIGTINEERAEISAQIERLDLSDPSDQFEYDTYDRQLCYLTSIQDYFMNSDRWTNFDSLELLKLYVEVLDRNYNAMCEYTNAMLPVDGGDLVGVTYEEWDKFEAERYRISNSLKAWRLFAEFCEHGRI